jgi:L-alanine-DL-glutamate epimerase-like enolase superfamily enzyme
MHLTWKRLHLHTRHLFRIAREGASVAGRDLERIVVRIEHDGTSGFGEAVPVPYYGQSSDSAEQTLQRAAPLLSGPPEPIEPIVDELLQRFDDQRATVAAIDAALHDWLGKRRSQPVWKLLGLDPAATPPTSMTIGIDAPGLIEQKVAEADLFQVLKIKVGTPDDETTLAAVRRFAPDKRLRVDANCGWSPEQVADRIAAVARFGLELIEQPLPPGCYDALRNLRSSGTGGVPIIADEDCVRPADVDKLAGVVDGVNIKLCKCGGIVEALRTIRRARQYGLAVMLGCMVETSLGVAPAAHVASLADYIDLDGHLLLADDPFAGLQLQDGIVRPGPGPGLGVAVRPSG